MSACIPEKLVTAIARGDVLKSDVDAQTQEHLNKCAACKLRLKESAAIAQALEDYVQSEEADLTVPQELRTRLLEAARRRREARGTNGRIK